MFVEWERTRRGGQISSTVGPDDAVYGRDRVVQKLRSCTVPSKDENHAEGDDALYSCNIRLESSRNLKKDKRGRRGCWNVTMRVKDSEFGFWIGDDRQGNARSRNF